MKGAAVTGFGKKRDFTDLFFLLKTYTILENLNFYKEKYPDGNMLLVTKSLVCFLDAEDDEPFALFKKADCPTVKKTIDK